MRKIEAVLSGCDRFKRGSAPIQNMEALFKPVFERSFFHNAANHFRDGVATRFADCCGWKICHWYPRLSRLEHLAIDNKFETRTISIANESGVVHQECRPGLVLTDHVDIENFNIQRVVVRWPRV